MTRGELKIYPEAREVDVSNATRDTIRVEGLRAIGYKTVCMRCRRFNECRCGARNALPALALAS
jgi:hypothetical protein